MTRAHQIMALRILDAIEKQPDAFDMTGWFNTPIPKGGKGWVDIVPLEPETEELSCGTTLCVAGWAAHLDGYRLTADGAERDGCLGECYSAIGGRLLGVDRHDGDQSDLFYAPDDVAVEMLKQIAKGNAPSRKRAERKLAKRS